MINNWITNAFSQSLHKRIPSSKKYFKEKIEKPFQILDWQLMLIKTCVKIDSAIYNHLTKSRSKLWCTHGLNIKSAQLHYLKSVSVMSNSAGSRSTFGRHRSAPNWPATVNHDPMLFVINETVLINCIPLDLITATRSDRTRAGW